MEHALTPASVAIVRATIARAIAGEHASIVTVGRIALHAGQVEGVRRSRDAIARYGGVLIAHDVGSGKTFVALAIATGYTNPLILAPAALRTMWAGATARAALAIPFVSIESLGHGRPPPCGHDIVVIDEAHHLRNASTKSYRAVCRATDGAHVVLLTATPVHNAAADLDALLALFLGANAADLGDEDRARIVVRGADSAAAGPAVLTHPPTAIRDAADVVQRVFQLSPPFAPRDGGVAATLLRLSFLRAWCSSVGAFSAMLRRASLRTAALADALRAGRHPTRSELAAWAWAGDGQLAFPELVVSDATPGAQGLAIAERHLAALSSLRELASAHATIDDERADQLRTITRSHAGVPVLACTQYAATVDALWTRLRAEPGVAALTSRGARIASGPISREDALARFAPVAHGARAPHERERIRLLLSTDVVSEGLNLHDAGVVVHLDLPWTVARLAQRVGRIARLGSPHPCVHAYQFAAPNAAAAALDLIRRLRTKRRIASQLVGGSRRLAQLIGGGVEARESPSEAQVRIVEALSRFARDERAMQPVVCCLIAAHPGWLALIESPASLRLVAKVGRAQPSTDPRIVATTIAWLANGEERPLDSCAQRATAGVTRWLARDRARHLAGTDRPNAARAHSRAIATAVASVSAAKPHERVRSAQDTTTHLHKFSLSPTHPLAHSPQQPLAPRASALVVFCTHAPTTPVRNSV